MGLCNLVSAGLIWAFRPIEMSRPGVTLVITHNISHLRMYYKDHQKYICLHLFSAWASLRENVNKQDTGNPCSVFLLTQSFVYSKVMILYFILSLQVNQCEEMIEAWNLCNSAHYQIDLECALCNALQNICSECLCKWHVGLWPNLYKFMVISFLIHCQYNTWEKKSHCKNM